ncbi:MAG: capsular exopolysaccharide synthesis family protein, partial [Flammeovirgaceae bacterium]
MNSEVDNHSQAPFEEIPDLMESFSFGKLFFVFKKSIPWLLALLLISVLSAFFYLRYSKPVYSASAVLKLDIQSSTGLLNIDLGDFSRGIDLQLEGEIELLRSPVVYRSALNTLNLDISYFSEGEILDDEKFPIGPFKVNLLSTSPLALNKEIHVSIINEKKYLLSYEKEGETIEKEYLFDTVVNDGFLHLKIDIEYKASKQKRYFFIINSTSSLVQDLSRNLSVSIINPNAKTIGISFKNNNQDKAVAVVNAIIDSYIDKTEEQKNKAYEQSLAYLESQISMTRDTLNVYDSIISLEVGGNVESLLLEDNSSIIEEIKRLRQKKLELQEEIFKTQYIGQLLKADSSYESISYIASTMGIENINGKIRKIILLQEQADRINKSYESSVKKDLINSKIEDEKLKFLQRIQFSLSQMRTERRNYENERLILERKLTIPKGESISAELKKLNRYFETYEEVYQELLGKRIEIGIAKASTVPSFQILAQPAANPVPISPMPKNTYTLAIVAFVFASIFLILILYFSQNKINSLAELSKIIQAPVLGIVPKYKKQQMLHSQLIVHRNPKASITEAMRSIRTNLDFINADQKDEQKVISVTSTISGEGKTFVALNLAGVLALTNKKVIILDLDLRKPKIHFGFGVENDIGVTSILIGQNTIEDCVRDSEIENLKFITSGPLPPNPSEMLMSNSFKEFMEDLKSKFDVIIFDTPPVGLVTDGIIIMEYATHPIYVLRAEYSKLSFANNLNKLVLANNFNKLSAVLNAVTAGNTYGGYG